jgi:hypothetical protein
MVPPQESVKRIGQEQEIGEEQESVAIRVTISPISLRGERVVGFLISEDMEPGRGEEGQKAK